MEKLIISIFPLAEPMKSFLACDIDEGRDFVDPFELWQMEDYDPYGMNDLGCVAYGGNLEPGTLLKAYKWGIFPWYDFKSEEKFWYCPSERYVIFPDKIHVGHSLRNLMNKTDYRLTINKAFEQVIRNCSIVNNRNEHEGAWLGEEIIEKFLEFNKWGYAKSVELWEKDHLVGGFYGVWINGVFQGDSMFSLRPSASQIALVKFCRVGEIDGKPVKFIDTQYKTQMFEHLGGQYISYKDFRNALESED